MNTTNNQPPEEDSNADQPAATPETQPEPENMEVHYEPHFKHSHHKKHLAEYAKEFLMIFFAVFLGFLAENLREHIAESTKEKDYIRGFISDLKNDQVFLNYDLRYESNQVDGMDSLAKLAKRNTSITDKQFYILSAKYTIDFMPFFSNDATMQQVKNSDGLKLLDKNHAADSIVAYYSAKDWLQGENNNIGYFFKELVHLEDKLFAYDILYDPKIKLLDKSRFPRINRSMLGPFANKLFYVRHLIKDFTDHEIESRMKQNKALIKFLQKTYHLKNE